MLNALSTKKRGHKETFGSDGYVCYLGCSDMSWLCRAVKVAKYLRISQIFFYY